MGPLLLCLLLAPAVLCDTNTTDCSKFTFGDCGDTLALIHSFVNISNAALCQTVCGIYSTCNFFDFSSDKNCSVYHYDLQLQNPYEHCKRIGAPANTDIKKCVQKIHEKHDPLFSSCKTFFRKDCISVGNMKIETKMADPTRCKKLLRKTDLIYNVSYFSYDYETKTCALYDSNDTTCHGLSGPSLPLLANCAESDFAIHGIAGGSAGGNMGAGSMIILGGRYTFQTEVWSPNGGPNCTVDALTLEPQTGSPNWNNGLVVDWLGGNITYCSDRKCYRAAPGWEEFGLTQHRRHHHTGFKFPDDKVLLVGGTQAATSTEVISPDGGSKLSFNLNKDWTFQCSIQINEDTMVLTGGRRSGKADVLVDEISNVTSDTTGSVVTTALPALNRRRYMHACGHYTNGTSTILIVAGGQESDNTVETLNYTLWTTTPNDPQAKWFYTTKLDATKFPGSGLEGTKGLVLRNIFYVVAGQVAGNQIGGKLVVSWDPKTETWNDENDINNGRYKHGGMAISSSLAEQLCTNSTI